MRGRETAVAAAAGTLGTMSVIVVVRLACGGEEPWWTWPLVGVVVGLLLFAFERMEGR